VGAAFGLTASATAATFQVDRTDDANVSTCDTATANDCTLRGAIAKSNADVGPSDTITFASTLSGEITLGNQISITNGVTIQGPGADDQSIDGDGNDRIFSIFLTPSANYEETVEISGLTLTNGSAATGAAIYDDNSELHLINDVISDSYATSSGGAIFENGLLDDGTRMLISGSTISGNTAHFGRGGAVYAYHGFGTIENSTLYDNRAFVGGAIHTEEGEAGDQNVILDSTVAYNEASFGGGLATSGGTVQIGNSIISGNSATGDPPDDPGGQDFLGDTFDPTAVTARFSILGDAVDQPIGDEVPSSNITTTNPLLGYLDENGGPTPTIAPSPTSPAVDCGSSSATTDQRGSTRPVDLGGRTNSNVAGADGSDIGAFELTGSASGACPNVIGPSGPGTQPPGPQPLTPAGPSKKKCKKKKHKKHSASAAKKKKCKKKKKR
jgi:hypothetical protein